MNTKIKKYLRHSIRMTSKNSALMFTIALTFFNTSCNKVTEIETGTIPSPAQISKMFDDNLSELTEKDSFNASVGNYVFTSKKGTTVTINTSCLKDDGITPTGNLTIEFVELFDRKDMLLTNKPTMADLGQNSELLISGGEIMVKVKKDGRDLTTTCPIPIVIKSSNSNGTKDSMLAFKGNIQKGELLWSVLQSTDMVIDKNNNTYNFSIPGFGWFNCDKFYNDPRPKTKLTLKVPTGYENSSNVFLMVKGQPNALGKSFGKFPIGLECYLIFITLKDEKYQWIIRETTLVNNHTETFDLNEAKVGSKHDYVGHVTLLR